MASVILFFKSRMRTVMFTKKYKIDKNFAFRQVIPGHVMWNVLIRNRVVNLHYTAGKWNTVRGVVLFKKPQERGRISSSF